MAKFPQNGLNINAEDFKLRNESKFYSSKISRELERYQ